LQLQWNKRDERARLVAVPKLVPKVALQVVVEVVLGHVRARLRWEGPRIKLRARKARNGRKRKTMNNTKSRKRRGPEGVRGSLIPHGPGLYGLRKGNGEHQVLCLRVEDNLDNLRISRDRILGLLLRIAGEMASGVIRLRMILGVRQEIRRRVRRAMGRMGILF
jgi:hypothetical protein